MTRSEQIAIEIVETLKQTGLAEWMSAQATWQYGRTGAVSRATRLLKQWGVLTDDGRPGVYTVNYDAPAFGEPTVSYTASA